MEKLESPHVSYRHMGIGLSKDFFKEREIETLWDKVNEIIDWINKQEENSRTKK
jgi:hypothetical protein